KSATSIREIDLSPKLKQELRKLYDDQSDTKVTADDIVTVPPTGLVFVTEDGSPIEPDRFAKHQFATAVKRAKIGKVRFHDLRHTFGSIKIEQGENLYYVQRQMGHSSIEITVGVYGHLIEARKAAAAAKTDEFIFSTKKPSN